MKTIATYLLLMALLVSPVWADLTLTEGEGIDITKSGAGGTLTVSGENASTTNKGISSFDSTDFSVSGGVVSLGAAPSATTFTGALSGNAATASALAANPTDCSAGEYATTIDASGNLTCDTPAGASVETDPVVAAINGIVKSNGSTISTASAGTDYVVPAGNVATATALAADPAGCSAGNWTTDINASGTATCSDPTSIDDCTAVNACTIDAESVEGTDLGTLTDTKVCTYDQTGTEIDCATTMTADQVGTVTSGSFCTGDGSAVQCTTAANAGTDITANLEEEVTEGSLADSTIISADIKDGVVMNADVNWSDMTDLASGGAVTWGNLAEGELTDSSIVSADIKDGTIAAGDLASDSVTEAKLKAVDSASDEECLTYETTTGDFEWQACGSGTPGGSATQVQFNSGGSAFGGITGFTTNGTNLTGTGTLDMGTGIVLVPNSSDVSARTSEGSLAWDNDNDQLFVGDGAAVNQIPKAGTLTDTKICTWDATGLEIDCNTTGGGTGDVVGPASSTDNAITRFDSTTGKLLQNSTVTVSDLGEIGIPTGVSLKIGTNSFITDVQGEQWLTSNAYWDNTNHIFKKVVSDQNAILMQLMGGDKGWPIGGDPIYGTRAGEGSLSDGFAMWKVTDTETNIANSFAGAGGPALMFGSLYGNFAIGGQGFELDGDGTMPYGRIIHSPGYATFLDGTIYSGIAYNVYGQLGSGLDSASKPGWFAGVETEAATDAFAWRRIPASTTLNKTNMPILMKLHNTGVLETIYGLELENGTDPDVASEGEVSWDSDDDTLRGHDGTNQVVIGRKNKEITAAIVAPNSITGKDKLVLWKNLTGFVLNITKLFGSSSASSTCSIQKIGSTGTGVNWADIKEIESLPISTLETTAGINWYYGEVTSGINWTTVQANEYIGINWVSGSPDSVLLEVQGWLNSDVN